MKISANFTKKLLIIGTAIIVLLDVILELFGVTISATMKAWKIYPILPCFMGVLTGHLYLGIKKNILGDYRTIKLICIAITLISWQVIFVALGWQGFVLYSIQVQYPIIPVLIGGLMGSLLWSQNIKE